MDRHKRHYRNAICASAVLFLSLSLLWVRPTQVFAERPPAVTPTPTPRPKVSPSPVAATPTAPAQTLESLQAKIRQRIASPEVARGRVGVKIVSLSTGKTLFENDAEKYFMPASNMKNFTVAAALEKLTPDFKFVTSVYANERPGADGVIRGDLRIYGRGDVSISTAFNNGDHFRGLDDLADKVAAAGVKRVEGDLIGDESYFKGYAIPQTWEWNDLQWYYGAEVSAFPINDSAVDLKVTASSAGGACSVSLTPQSNVMQVVNLCTTASTGAANSLRIFKSPGKNAVEISGSLPLGEKFEGYIAVSHPADLFLDLLKQRLSLKGITVTGTTRAAVLSSPPPSVEIARLESPALPVIAGRTMKASQNLYTETLLWTLGEVIGRKNAGVGESSALGLSVVSKFLTDAGVPAGSVLQYDGSGLSRHNLITPSAVTALYRYMARQSRYSAAWLDSLSVGGVDGTLNKRFKGTTAAGILRGKTGTFDQVSALSGYLTTASGDQLVISVMVNGVAEAKVRTGLIDNIVVDLVNFDGKVE